MSLTKVHVECGVIVDLGNTSIFYGLWSETIDLGSSTTKVATDTSSGLHRTTGQLVFRVKAPTASEVYVAEGVNPDATAVISTSEENNRGCLSVGELRDFPTKAGNKVATGAVS